MYRQRIIRHLETVIRKLKRGDRERGVQDESLAYRLGIGIFFCGGTNIDSGTRDGETIMLSECSPGADETSPCQFGTRSHNSVLL